MQMGQGDTPPTGFDAVERKDYTGGNDNDLETAVAEVPKDGQSDAPVQPPTRVCPKCSALERTNGTFCPHCGAAYERRKRRTLSRRTKIIVATIIGLVLLGGAGAAIVLKQNHDDEIA